MSFVFSSWYIVIAVCLIAIIALIVVYFQMDKEDSKLISAFKDEMLKEAEEAEEIEEEIVKVKKTTPKKSTKSTTIKTAPKSATAGKKTSTQKVAKNKIEVVKDVEEHIVRPVKKSTSAKTGAKSTAVKSSAKTTASKTGTKSTTKKASTSSATKKVASKTKEN